MITNQHCRTMAQYNSWMNTAMYALCATLRDETRKAAPHASFRSIHSALNHILAVDLMLLSHFTRGTPTFLPRGDLYRDFDALRQARRETDLALLSWSDGVAQSWLAEPTCSEPETAGLPRRVTRGFWVAQLFQHQTHHRGQITGLLTQLGQDIGSNDLYRSVVPSRPARRSS
jgi:uncharacterized damage-inducible protein DinB